MDPMTMALGGQVLGGFMGKRSASKARKANAAQQAAALAFQREQQAKALAFGEQMRGLQLGQLDLAQKGGMERIAAQGEGRMGDTLSRLAGAGFNPSTSVGLGALRATKMDTRNALGQLASQMAAQRSAVFGAARFPGEGMSYPMIQHQAQGGQGQGIANLASMLAMMGGPTAAAGMPGHPSGGAMQPAQGSVYGQRDYQFT